MLNNRTFHNYPEQKLTAKQILRIEIEETTAALIRKKFDRAFMADTMDACIELANELGFKDLAEEMITDANLEREAYA